MGIMAWPLDNITYDGDDVRGGYAPRGSGVYSMDEHFPLTISGNQATVGTGSAWMQLSKLKGLTWQIESAESLSIPTISGNQVARLFFHVEVATQVMNVQFRVGSSSFDASINPVQTSTIFELAPYDLRFANGAYTIIDNRPNERLCGVMRDEVTKIVGTQEILDRANNLVSTLTSQSEQLREIIDDIEGGNPYMLRAAYDPGSVVNDAGGILHVNKRDNLLDNWHFVRPVNQRNITGTFSTENAYFIDRWKLMSGTVTMTNSGLVLNGTMSQILELPVGQEVYPSVKMVSGAADASYDDNSKTFTVTSGGGTILAAKLEIGNLSTIDNDARPDFGLEFSKCQRFLFTLRGEGPINGFTNNGGIAFVVLPTPTTMRIRPTCSDVLASNWGIRINGAAYNPTSVSVFEFYDHGIMIQVNGSGFPGNGLAATWHNGATARTYFSAEL